MTILDSLTIGIFQGIAIIPGISRSGSTIVAGLLRGLDRSLATEFSFFTCTSSNFWCWIIWNNRCN